MRNSKLAKNILTYLPVLAVLAATIIGLFLGTELYSTSLDSQAKIPTLLPAEPNDPQPLINPEALGPCGLSNIYTSLPPKCKTLKGKFILVPGFPSNIFVIPERK
jgi:hypothetical protein